jgi:hypothetical protein
MARRGAIYRWVELRGKAYQAMSDRPSREVMMVDIIWPTRVDEDGSQVDKDGRGRWRGRKVNW